MEDRQESSSLSFTDFHQVREQPSVTSELSDRFVNLLPSNTSITELDRFITEAERLSEEERLEFFLQELSAKKKSPFKERINEIAACLLEAPLGTMPIFVIMRFLEAYPNVAQESLVDFLWVIVTAGRTWGVSLKALELSHIRYLKNINLIRNNAITPLSITFITLLRSLADIYAGIIMNDPTYNVSNEEFFSIVGSLLAFSGGLLVAPPLLAKLGSQNKISKFLHIDSRGKRAFHYAGQGAEFIKKGITFSGIFYASIAVFGNMSLATVDILTIKMALGFSLLVGMVGAIYSQFDLPNKNISKYIPDIFRSLAAVAYEFLTFSLLIKHRDKMGPYALIPYLLAPITFLLITMLLTSKLGKNSSKYFTPMAENNLIRHEEADYLISTSSTSAKTRGTFWNPWSRRHSVNYEEQGSSQEQEFDQENGCVIC